MPALMGGGGVEREKAYAHRREGERERERERETERERERACLTPPFICFLPPGPGLCKLGSARSAVLPDSFFDLPLFYFRWLFPSLSFSHHHFGLLFSILTT